MTYTETTDFLFQQFAMYQKSGGKAYKPGLSNAEELDQYFNHPHQSYKTIHIAGTNGKGSTSHMLASILQMAGYKVGLYTSPHILDFRERIRVSGTPITEDAVVSFIKNHQTVIQQIQPSFFEITVAMAFDYFRERKVDIAIIEVGLGGRFDSTNIIQPILSIVTNIGLDHVAFLGNTLSSIAKEKAGIIKHNTPVVIGEKHQETTEVFEQIATEKQASIIWAQNEYKIPYLLQTVTQRQVINVRKDEQVVYENLELDLLGKYQKHNLITVLAAVNEIQKQEINILEKDIYSGLKQVAKTTGLKGRWQIIGNNPLIVCDAGHNEDGVKQIVEQIKNTAHKELHIIWGMVNDKDINVILQLLPKSAHYYFTRPSIERALSEHTLMTKCQEFGLKGESYNTVTNALAAAKINMKREDFLFIGGSTFIVADCLLIQ